MKRWQKIVLPIIMLLCAIPAGWFIALQIPSVQTKICRHIASAITDRKINGKIDIGGVYFSPFDNVVVKDATITDTAGDTILHCGKAAVDIRPLSFLTGEYKIKKISLSDGVVNLSRDEDGVVNLSKLIIPKEDKKRKADSDTTAGKRRCIELERFLIEDFAFNYRTPEADTLDGITETVDWHNIRLSEIKADFRNIGWCAGAGKCDIRKFSMSERRGYRLEELKGNIAMDSTGIRIDKFLYDDNCSRMVLPKAILGFHDMSDLKDFVHRVQIVGDFDDALLDLTTLHYFLPRLEDIRLKLRITGLVTGTVSNLKSEALSIKSGTRRTNIDTKVHLTGLPKDKETMAALEIFDCNTDFKDLAEIISEVTGPGFNKNKIASFAPGERFHFKGSLNGFFEDFVAFGALNSNIGDACVDILCRNERKTGYEIDGFLTTSSLDLGKILNIEELGCLDSDGAVNAFMGKRKSHIKLDHYSIESLDFKGYDYHDITASGDYDGLNLNASIVSNDPNIDFVIDGSATLDKKESPYGGLTIDLRNLDLAALNLTDKDASKMSFRSTGEFVGGGLDDLIASLSVTKLVLRDSEKRYRIGDIEADYFSKGEDNKITLVSPFLEASYTGTAPVDKFIDDIKALLLKKNLDNLVDDPDKIADYSGNSYTLDILTHDSKKICNFLNPDLYVADGTRATLAADHDGNGRIGLKSELFAIGNKFFKDVDIRFRMEEKGLTGEIASDLIRIGNFELTDASASASVAENVANLGLSFKNENITDSKLNASIAIRRKEEGAERFAATISNSEFRLGEESWQLLPGVLGYGEKTLSVKNIGIVHKGESIRADGNLADTLKLTMNNFDASVANLFLGEKMRLGGSLTGTAEIIDAFNNFGMLANIKAKEMRLGEDSLGDFEILSKWDEGNKRINLLLNNTLEGHKALNLLCSYKPKEKSISATATLDNFAAAPLENFISSILTDVSGTISGEVEVSGTAGAMKVKCNNGRLNKFAGTLDYTKVPYTIDGPFTIDDSGLHFRRVTISDSYGHTGRVRGGVNWNNLKDINLDVNITTDNIHALNTSASDNKNFYGRAFGTGTVKITGPMDAIYIDIGLTTNSGSIIHIPLSSSGKGSTDLLTFVSDDNAPRLTDLDSIINRTIQEEAKKSGSSLGVRVCINATPDAEIQLEINKAMGDVLKSRGSGLIDIHVDDGEFNIKGDYGIEEGSYKFVLLGITSRDFTIEPGGSIAFVGDIMQSNLDLTAKYRTKASIAPLIADSTATSTRRVVDCGIDITGKLSNPTLGFNIDIPDLDPTTQGRVESTLNTESKRIKQFVALILSGSFLPDEESGIMNNTSVSYFNATEIMSSQLNSIFRQLDIPLDLGFNYQPGQNGHDLFDVAVSTQLFNNRVSINGNIGNRQYTNKSDVVGDIDVEIKLDKQGRIRLTLFSHSADEYSNYLDQTQRNGAGLVYQEEFDTFKELYRKIFWSKKRREAAQREALGNRGRDPNSPVRDSTRRYRRDTLATISLMDTIKIDHPLLQE